MLRAHLHYEIARCEMSADFLVKAAEQLTSGLALDYGTAAKEPADVITGLHFLVIFHIVAYSHESYVIHLSRRRVGFVAALP